MIGIREFTQEDIPQVADLHRDAMHTAPKMTTPLLDRYREWFTSVFLNNPMRVNRLESLVCDDDGEIVGFLGVVARQVSIGGRVLQASAASNFCVHPARRGRLGMQLAREYLARSSDLAFIDELMDRPRQLWDHLGMHAMPQSVRWTLPLRPVQHVLSLVEQHLPRPLGATARPLAGVLDWLVKRVPRNPFRSEEPELAAEELTATSLSQYLREFGADDLLRPVTSDGSTEWLIARARSMAQHGDLQMVALRNALDALVGWYIYYARSGKPCELMQLVAEKSAADQVLDHLAIHAGKRGVISLTGTLDPAFLTALSDHWAVISPTPMATRWLLVHSKRPEVLEAFWRGRVLLSRLDGEWFQHFP